MINTNIFKINYKKTVKDLIKLFNYSVSLTKTTGFVVVVNANEKVIGVISEGDLRRFFLEKGKIDETVEKLIKKNFNYFFKDSFDSHEAIKIFDQGIKHIPILTKDYKLLEVLVHNSFYASQRLKPAKSVRCRAPLRISFSGGGTDMSYFFNKSDGHVLSSTIDKFCYASVTVRNDEKIKIVNETINKRYVYKNINELTKKCKDLIGTCVKVMQPNYGCNITISSDVDVGRGLGSSSAITAAVLGALNFHRINKNFNNYELADMAYQIERIEMNFSGGWQDQYATVFGGLNFIKFSKEGILVSPIRISKDILLELQNRVLLFKVGKKRISSNIINKQKKDYLKNKKLFEIYKKQSLIAIEFRDCLLRGDFKKIGQLMNKSWMIKKKFTKSISNSQIDKLYKNSIKLGAEGGKIIGAGGSGYLVLICHPQYKLKIINYMKKNNIKLENFNFIKSGIESWTY